MSTDANPRLSRLGDPPAPEHLYRDDPAAFGDWLTKACLVQPHSETLAVWRARLLWPEQTEHHDARSAQPEAVPTDATPAARRTVDWSVLGYLLAASLTAFFAVRLPDWLQLDADWFYPRFVALIAVAPLLDDCRGARAASRHLGGRRDGPRRDPVSTDLNGHDTKPYRGHRCESIDSRAPWLDRDNTGRSLARHAAAQRAG